MRLAFSKAFIRQARKLNPPTKAKLEERLALFARNPLDPALRNHALKGAYKEYRSIDITGDIRALYLARGEEAIFDLVGTHSQLYG